MDHVFNQLLNMYISDIVNENILSVVFFEYSTLSDKEVDINFRNCDRGYHKNRIILRKSD